MTSSIESVAAIAAAQTGPASDTTPAAASGTSASGTFSALMQQGLTELNGNVGAAETALAELAAGRPVQLHEVMIDLERARMSVQTFIQVRNKLIESYQELLRMQL
jgi:flagellar hook-basal body complex protein FliE